MPRKNKTKEYGKIISFFAGVAKIKGLNEVFLHEILLNKKGETIAIVIAFNEDFVDALFFNNKFNLNEKIFRGKEIFSIKVSNKIIGRILNGLGQSADKYDNPKGKKQDIFQEAPKLINRAPVTRSLTTGIKVIDTTLPLGRGQRELIIGDQKLGKSSLAINTVLNQKNAKDKIYCIYALIGQKQDKIRKLIKTFEKENAFLYSTIIAAPGNASFAELYLTPFVACTIGEYLRDNGKDVLIIYDDLSKHAKAYRDISLLLEETPGREAYPGDIFSLHARLLERAANLNKKNGGGSLTALPIIETNGGDISAFIPTNLISITDGQIYLENNLFQKAILPAVNIGLSVSRIGGKAQPPLLKKIVGGIRLILSQQKELKRLSELEKDLNPAAQQKLHRGELMMELLKQDKTTYVSWPEQAILFYLIDKGYFDDITINEWIEIESLFRDLLKNKHQKILDKIEKNKFTIKIQEKLDSIVKEFKDIFIYDEK